MKRGFVVVSGKGGTGKTVVSANLGFLLAEAGNVVLLVDGDLEFACLSRLFGVADVEVDLVRVVSEGIPLWKAVHATRVHSRLGIIPVRPFRRGSEGVLFDDFVRMLGSIADRVDYVIVDAGQGLGGDVVRAMSAFREYLVVVEPDVWSLDAALFVKGTGDNVRARALGFILNDVEDQGLLRPEVVRSFERILDMPFLGAVPHDPAMKVSSARLEVLAKVKPDSPAAMALRSVAARIMGVKQPPVVAKPKRRLFRLGFLRRGRR